VAIGALESTTSHDKEGKEYAYDREQLIFAEGGNHPERKRSCHKGSLNPTRVAVAC
jgi:hypothetical protein